MSNWEWKIVWREIGWVNPNTIREGWAIVDLYHDEGSRVYAWIEDSCLAINDQIDYYPHGCYDIPLDLIDELKLRGNNYHNSNLEESI